MAEVKCSLNGKNFKDYNVYVNRYNGIANTLKRKKINYYDWAEYDGIAPDLSTPRFEPREIELRCFITGDNWQDLFDKFNSMIRDEFAKPGTQRILIEPFGHKPMPYDVIMVDSVNVDKTFNDGKMIALFTLKLIEPNPIKKVLKLSEGSLNLKFYTSKFVDIFWGDGTFSTAIGFVDKSTDYSAATPAKIGENIADLKDDGFYYAKGGINDYMFSADVSASVYTFWLIGRDFNDNYFVLSSVENSSSIIHKLNLDSFKKVFIKVTDSTGADITANITNVQIRVVVMGGTWYNSGYPKIIVIAGDQEGISDFQTNAEVLWEKL